MVDDLWKVLEHTNDWLRFADTKAAGSLAGSGVLGGLAANALIEDTAHVPCAALVLIIPGLACLLLAAGLAVLVIAPRLDVGEPTSLIYYEHVARKYANDVDGHHRDLQELLGDDDALAKQLANQVWANATVARRKYRLSSWSLITLAIALLLLTVGASVTTLT